MTERSPVCVLDEGALANDIVRLLGGENQRLKRELGEAQQRAQHAENQIRALTAASSTGSALKNEFIGQDHSLPGSAREHLLDEEILTLRAQYQELEAKYEEERVMRKLQESETNELKARSSDLGIEERTDHLGVQEQRRAGTAFGIDTDERIKELLEQVEHLRHEKQADRQRLEEAHGKIEILTCNDPWAYIDESRAKRSFDGPLCIKSFQQFNKFSVKSIDAFCENILKPLGLACNPFVRRRRDILWSRTSPGFGVSLSPLFHYKVDTSTSNYKWIINETQTIEGPFELLFETRGFWYYCGTFTTGVIESRKNGSFFSSLQPQVREILMSETIEKTDLLAPVTEKSIGEMYLQGILPISCLIFERIGFNHDVHEALLGLGKPAKGPEFVFESSKVDMKREAKAKRKAADGKILEGKRAKLDLAQAGPSTSLIDVTLF